MANIGTFTNTENGFVGEIVTLTFRARNVRLIPETNGSSENAPSHRAFVGRAEIGAAWSKRSGEGRDYLSVKLDDPSFNAPIYANLFEDENEETFTRVPRPQSQRRLRHPRRAPPGSGRRTFGNRQTDASTVIQRREHRSPPGIVAFTEEGWSHFHRKSGFSSRDEHHHSSVRKEKPKPESIPISYGASRCSLVPI